ncbi:MAG: F0F1 ATP synthase subunit A [Candidatus Gracilibacteria bacterium]|nr:F0F1 ATP synthase subunit A [Candidatus Gracilibacteria bacterium]MDD2908198.1 F0F1 ATP synthase subunit A [Candidatus Gracilibacteria bacterium]
MTTKGPHIPAIQGSFIEGTDFSILGFHFEGLTSTIISTWIFMVLFFIVLLMFRLAIKNKGGFFKTTGLIAVGGLYNMATDFIGDKKFAKRVLFLVGGMFIFIFLSNVFSLFLDWMLLFVSEERGWHEYLRPINSDPNTTFALSLSIIVISHFIAVYKKGLPKYLKGYIFNFEGHDLIEKCVNVFVGWLHFIGEIVKTLSLSLRLFGNIFAGVVLISMLAFLGGMISLYGLRLGEFMVLPFWFFELFVALIQAVVFFVLSSMYFRGAIEEHH